ncbi:putative Lon protease [Clostridium pasteurianum DSM 525 = ATCC 6013]|uniref:endopeptidase La n=1 Tax=Clostridium pasteurianum DSM 525 = ATCC 6013 TaxID=1262449 RepID=A0A0H3J4M3_CLOPA|nr:AAA family ATPase [Clostridium pasteurianum]AJA47917.1 putative Lon protease [Clostridium pasteurianum DSM 525 = ATCC 6013]AJA51905.1 putative Lon protease [Clostridium pasteurianum DSM 525 = ATCC 6013]AOZ75205.1 ATP-dependent protease [Clostridium pasteurianum DSM 525 = ATCC 6013]AOZ79000.1 ATP-dependent protease [Clostridium pasteurianum]ELP59820.1 ATP-dependent protease [Clostridium pasteurianum DSM 525 = ATCC 6013]
MKRELTPKDVIYNVHIDGDENFDNNIMPQYEDIYSKLSQVINIDKYGYNVYIVDNFTKEKLDDIIIYVKKLYKDKINPKDICYAVSKDEKSPVAITIDNGKGILFKETVEEIKKLYMTFIYNFYNSSSNKEKELIIDRIQRKKNELIDTLIERSHSEGFEIKITDGGFSFIPMKENKLMTESDYDVLSASEKEGILSKIKRLRSTSKDILEELKNIEKMEIQKIKNIFKDYFDSKLNISKDEYIARFEDDKKIYEYIKNMFEDIEESVIDNYSINYEEDEENIISIISKYAVNVLVDNSKNKNAPVIYEEDPNLNNLIGTIEYENHNGSYITDVNLIKAGSILKANGGCLIIRMDNLVNNLSAYYYLKKVLLNEKVTFNYSKGYLELITLNSLSPEPIRIKEKIIVIGDYNTYHMLYNYDNDFRNIFKIKAEFKSDIRINSKNKAIFFNYIKRCLKNNNIKSMTSLAIDKLAKHLSRKAENRNKLYLDSLEIDKILMMANSSSEKNNRNKIIGEDVLNAIYGSSILEDEILEMYEENKILLDVKDKKIGQINGLSVIDTGYMSLGKPNRITCTCYKGNGNIIDIQKDSNLSGNIHSKSINILKGWINNALGNYKSLSVDFHLCFEQLYGKIEGDSASVAEVLCMISSLSRIPIRQNMAVTGSIDQFGEVQPIGGVNEKIEGFFNVCKILDSVDSKGVLIPERNIDSIILKDEVEEAIRSNKFHIYTMENIYDAMDIMMGNDSLDSYKIIKFAENEMNKYRLPSQ